MSSTSRICPPSVKVLLTIALALRAQGAACPETHKDIEEAAKFLDDMRALYFKNLNGDGQMYLYVTEETKS